ncbi:hypothetical protein BD779DRAFT_1476915 [Infundibulicybe gibba]|nr:hypothetical protein BD779DRAFT_1476915 [Infundibulicybe gibba]
MPNAETASGMRKALFVKGVFGESTPSLRRGCSKDLLQLQSQECLQSRGREAIIVVAISEQPNEQFSKPESWVIAAILLHTSDDSAPAQSVAMRVLDDTPTLGILVAFLVQLLFMRVKQSQTAGDSLNHLGLSLPPLEAIVSKSVAVSHPFKIQGTPLLRGRSCHHTKREE